MLDLSLKSMFQWGFALSPFPSYLPQYFAMMQQLEAAADGTSESMDPNSQTNNMISIDRGADYYIIRKRLNGNNGQSTTTTISPGGGSFMAVPGTPSKPQYEMMDEQAEAGMSPATIFILLAAHLLRMLYFHGLLLEEEQSHTTSSHHKKKGWFHPRALAGDELDPLADTQTISFEDELHLVSLKPTAVSKMISSISEKSSPIQWDLFGQSCSMIIMQVMLLHAMMRLRRKRLSRQKRKTDSEFSDDTIIPQIPQQLSPGNGHSNNSNGAQQILDTLSPQPFWQRQFEKIIRGVKSHFLHLISPSNILKHHTFLQYMELVCLSSMAVKLMFDYHWYPRYRMGIVEGLKHSSIGLESCLALPQAIKNHSGGTTEGLSLVMVVGWVAGDFFKLCYFLIGMISSSSEGEPTLEQNGNNVFAMGCLLALMMDLVVVMQMLCWYPTADVMQLRERITQSIRHWKTNKDDDAGKSLILNSPEYKKACQQSKGLFASAVHLFYAVFRRRPSNSSGQSLDS